MAVNSISLAIAACLPPQITKLNLALQPPKLPHCPQQQIFTTRISTILKAKFQPSLRPINLHTRRLKNDISHMVKKSFGHFSVKRFAAA
jgi:hypothetical protein